jgi:hypothetical protein
MFDGMAFAVNVVRRLPQLVSISPFPNSRASVHQETLTFDLEDSMRLSKITFGLPLLGLAALALAGCGGQKPPQINETTKIVPAPTQQTVQAQAPLSTTTTTRWKPNGTVERSVTVAPGTPEATSQTSTLTPNGQVTTSTRPPAPPNPDM